MSSLSVVFPLSSMSLIYSQMWKYFHLVVLLWCDSAECSRGFTYWELGRVCFQWYRIDVLISYRTLLCPKSPSKWHTCLSFSELVNSYFPSLSLRESQLSKNRLGPSFTLSRSKCTLIYPRTYYTLSSTPAQMSGLLSRSNTLSSG